MNFASFSSRFGFLKSARLDLFWKIGLLFTSVQALALLLSQRFTRTLAVPERKPVAPEDIGVFFLYLLLATLVLLVLMRFSHSKKALKYFWLAAIFGGLELFLEAFLRPDLALLLTLAIVALYWKAPTIWLHNFVLVLSLPAISAFFGSQIPPVSVVILLVLFAVYDVIAVYGTKHMVQLAHAFIDQKIIPGMIVSERPVDPTQYVGEVTIGAGFSVLGTGDFVFPAVLVASVALQNVTAAVIVAGFSVLGLFLTHVLFFGQRERRPMPALPPIAAFAILGFLVSRFLWR